MKVKGSGKIRASYSDSKNPLEILNRFNSLHHEQTTHNEPIEKKKRRLPFRKEFTLFNYHEDIFVKKQVERLMAEVRQEIKALQKANQSFEAKIRDIERIALQPLPKKPGIYHVRFFEIILKILKSMRAKIGESRTWLEALSSKKKKRGSLFTFRAKKKGTQYSLSEELKLTRQTG